MNSWLGVVLALAMIGMTGTARARDYNEKEIADLAGKAKAGAGFAQILTYPVAQAQTVLFLVPGVVVDGNLFRGMAYRIDLRAQLCFAIDDNSKVPVPCKNLKKGYPLLAPLITWDD